MVEGSEQKDPDKKELKSQHDHSSDLKDSVNMATTEATEFPSLDMGHPPDVSEDISSPEILVSSSPGIDNESLAPVAEVEFSGDTVADLTDPAGPADPVSDLTDPAGPADPVSDLTDPAGPADPVSDLTDPVSPADPVSDLTDPVSPADPVSDLTDPAGPADPVSDLTDPVSPADPVANISGEGEDDGVEDISSISEGSLADLLISEGSDIDIDDISSQFDTSFDDLIDDGELPDEIETVWEKTIKEIAYGEEDEEEVDEEVQKRSFFQKLKDIFSTRDYEVDVYDPSSPWSSC